jgi:hypothetical protein
VERGRRRGKGGSCHQTISFESLGNRKTKDGWEQREGSSSSVRGCLDTEDGPCIVARICACSACAQRSLKATAVAATAPHDPSRRQP